MDAAIPSCQEQHPKTAIKPHFYTTVKKPIYIYIYLYFFIREIFT